jgi:hypothetical protein
MAYRLKHRFWIPSPSSGGTPFVAPTAPIFYDFNPGEGWASGTSTQIITANGFSALIDNGGSGTTAAIKVNTTAGYIFGTSANTGVHTAKSISTGNSWFRVTVIGSASVPLEIHRNMVGGTDGFTGLRFSATPGSFLTNALRNYSNGVGGTSVNLGGFDAVNGGDSFEFETDATNKKLLIYMNGRQLTLTTTVPTSGYDISAYTITGNYGILGSASGSGAVDDMEFGDSTMGRLRLYMPARIVQREANGDVYFVLEGTYTQSDPAVLKYNIATSTGTAVLTGQTMQNAVIGSGSFSGKTATFTPTGGTQYVVTVYRDDATGANGSIIKRHVRVFMRVKVTPVTANRTWPTRSRRPPPRPTPSRVAIASSHRAPAPLTATSLSGTRRTRLRLPLVWPPSQLGLVFRHSSSSLASVRPPLKIAYRQAGRRIAAGRRQPISSSRTAFGWRARSYATSTLAMASKMLVTALAP